MTNVEFYSKMTVVQLRAILATDGIKVNSRTKKDILVTYVVNMMDDFHAVALEMDSQMSAPVHTMTMSDGSTIDFTGKSAMVLDRHNVNVKRYNPTMARGKDGKVRLTPKQTRRIHKKLRSYAKSIDFFEGAFSTK